MPSRRTALALLLIAGAAPRPASAADGLEEARRHYQRLEYDLALSAIEEAKRQAGGDPARLAAALLIQGSVDTALERDDEALVSFRRGLRLAPELTLPPGTSPKIRALFERAQALERSRAEERQRLTIALSPLRPPPVASRAVVVEAQVGGGGGAALRVQLAVVDERSRLSASIPMVEVTPGRWQGTIPGDLVRPSATLSLRAELSHEDELVRRAPPDDAPPLSLLLPARAAALEISSPLRGAEVRVDDQPVGRVPLPEPVAVAPGLRRVTVVARGAALAQEVTVRPGEIARLALTLDTAGARRNAARFTLLTLGGALLVGGAGMLVAAQDASRQLQNSVRFESGSHLPITDYASVERFDLASRGYSIAAIAGLSLGAVAALAGALLFAPRRQATR